ncbi:MAG: FAD-dependent oxidoreductase [Betaproteobacteria bacterium]
MGSPQHLIILGAGLMGRLLALALARQGHRVELYEAGAADGSGAAARVAAAMLAPLAESAVTELSVVRMGQHSLQRWPQLIAELGQSVFFQQQGTLIVWHRQDQGEAERLKRHLDRTAAALPELAPAQSLDAQAMGQREPAMAGRFDQGFFLPGEGQLDNRELLNALLHTLDKAGVQLHWHSPRQPEDFEPGRAGQPDGLFDCRGLGAQQQWRQLRGVRGEVARVHAPEVQLQRPLRLMHPRYPIYIAPKPDHVFVIGATEIESEDRSPASMRSTLELLSAAYSVHSGFAEARVLEIATQLRPTLPDNLPALRWLGPRSLQINGLYRHGFLIAPAMLDAALELWVDGHSPQAERWGLTIEGAASAALPA